MDLLLKFQSEDKAFSHELDLLTEQQLKKQEKSDVIQEAKSEESEDIELWEHLEEKRKYSRLSRKEDPIDKNYSGYEFGFKEPEVKEV